MDIGELTETIEDHCQYIEEAIDTAQALVLQRYLT